MIWDDIRITLMYTFMLVTLITVMPVAITGGVIASNYIFCDKLQLCQEAKK